ncbi:MAG: TlpA family protein disulfide reductase [Chitinophagaceae bacterium]|nr:TlpA family protein disulfide reductase [Chitinophagaceae bacterium]
MKIIKSFTTVMVIFVLALASCSASVNEGKKEFTDETIASEASISLVNPAFKMTDINGNTIDLQSLKGKKVFVNLWATWCPPCRSEIPFIEQLQSKVDKQKVAFVMLSLDDDFSKAKKFAKEYNLKLPVYYPAESLPKMFSTDGIPASFIFNERGELIKQNNGADDCDTEDYVQLLKS